MENLITAKAIVGVCVCACLNPSQIQRGKTKPPRGGLYIWCALHLGEVCVCILGVYVYVCLPACTRVCVCVCVCMCARASVSEYACAHACMDAGAHATHMVAMNWQCH